MKRHSLYFDVATPEHARASVLACLHCARLTRRQILLVTTAVNSNWFGRDVEDLKPAIALREIAARHFENAEDQKHTARLLKLLDRTVGKLTKASSRLASGACMVQGQATKPEIEAITAHPWNRQPAASP